VASKGRMKKRSVQPPEARDGWRTRRAFAGTPAVVCVVVALGALAVLVASSSVKVSEAGRAFRRSAWGGVERLSPGRHIVLPFLQRLDIIPPGPLKAGGTVAFRSREGIDLEVPYEVTAEIADDNLLRVLDSAPGGPGDVMRDAAARALSAWGAEASGETIVLLQGAEQADIAVRTRLEGMGFDAVRLRYDRVRGPSDVIASITSRALRDRLNDTGTRIALIGLDGADWQIIDPLIARGQLPNLARLKARGAWGNLRTMTPTLSPLLWTTVATGKTPEQHGIIDFLVRDPQTGRSVPVSSRFRKAKALWNMLSDAGRTSAFIAWWATWPAEAIDGTMVSDRVAYSLFGFEAGENGLAGATYPEKYLQEIRPKLTSDAAVTLAEVRRFADVSPEEFRALREQIRDNPKIAYRQPVNHLTKILASARSYQAIALDILERGQPQVFSIYYQGIDEVCHRFAHDMPPKMEMVSDDDYAKYKDVVFAYYRYQDALLGELLGRLTPGTTVILLSDHGFENGSSRPRKDPPYIEGKPGLWHRKYGIILLAGPGIRPGPLDTHTLLDVAPTVLFLAGLPKAEDMPGEVIREAIDPRFAARFPVQTIASYEQVGRPLEEVRLVPGAVAAVDEEMLEKLRSLGYIGAAATGPEGGAPAGQTTGSTGAGVPGVPGPVGRGPGGAGAGETLLTGFLNEAGVYLEKKEYARAETTVVRALKEQPDYLPALMLAAKIAAAQKKYGAAIDYARKAIAHDPEEDPAVYVELGRIYADSGRVEEGVAFFNALLQQHPAMAELHGALGSLLLQQKRTQSAEAELLEALRINPALTDPLTQLHTIYHGTDRVLTLEPIVRRGLAINDKSVVHLNWLGLIEEWKKHPSEAEAAYRKAMEFDPDYPATMANLGALYGRTGRLQQAVEILARAVAKDPDNLEAWVNLGAAQGRMGRSKDAVVSLETARRKGVRSTTLFNALALAYLQDRQRDQALEYLRQSLAIDPNQKDAQDLLEAVTKSS